MNNSLPQQPQPGAPQQMPGQMMPQAPVGPGGQNQRGGYPNQANQYQHQMAMAAQMQGINPMMMQGQMPPQGPQAQGQPPQQQHYMKGGPPQQPQYRQKGMPQNPGNPGQRGPPGGMMYNQMQQQQQQQYFQIPGDLMNRGFGPNNMIFPNQNGTASPPGKGRDKNLNLHSLYIGNLSKDTYDLDLYKFFSSNGYTIQSAKVMFDKDTNKSLGFGYLNFREADEAQRCMENMNNQTINGKQIVLNKKKEQDFDKEANVIVTNLPKDIDQKRLMELFQNYGKIASCKLDVYADGKSKGFGYVQFLEQQSAVEAIKNLNETMIDDKKISVAVHSKKDEREAQSEKFTNLFVRNLPANYTEEQLRTLYQNYGEINSVTMDQSKAGQGFVSFKDHEAAKKALDETNMKIQFEGQAIFVSSHIYKKENQLQKSSQIEQNQKEMFKSNIYVKYIPLTATKDDVEKVFKSAGPIISIKLKNYEIGDYGNKTPKYQIGYVLYESVKQAQKSIQLFDEVIGLFPDQAKPLKVDFWQAKDERQDAIRDKHVNYVTQLINMVKLQNKPGYQGGPGGGMQGNFMGGQTQGNYPNDGQQYQRGGRGFHRGRGGNQRGGRGGMNQNGRYNNRGEGFQNNYNKQNRGPNQYNNNGQMRQQYQNNMSQMGMPDQQQMGQQPPQQQQQMGQQPPQQQVMMQQQQQQQQQMPQQETPMQLPPVDVSQLDNLQGDERNNFVGNNIYQTIHNEYGDRFAPTITGMLLDESAVDFKLLLTQNQYFQAKAREAYELLVQSMKNKEQQMQQQTPQNQ